MNDNHKFARGLRSFFEEHLRARRNLSPHTVLAYRDAIKLFLNYAAQRHHVTVGTLGMTHLDVDTALSFLEHLEKERGVSIATRNHRLAALRSLFHYLAALDPEYFHQCHQILGIPFKRRRHNSVQYLSREEMDALIRQPDQTTARGRRDYVLLSLLYNTGCRVQEILELRSCDFCLDRPFQVRVIGKGRKERVCPLWPQTAKLIKGWLVHREIPPAAECLLFLNQRGQPLTRFGVRHIVQTYKRSAEGAAPSLRAKRVHPHTLRHTTAMHLLQSGVEVNMIRSILGHASVTTTNRYAEIDLEMKRRAIETGMHENAKQQSLPTWKSNKDLLAWLDSL